MKIQFRKISDIDYELIEFKTNFIKITGKLFYVDMSRHNKSNFWQLSLDVVILNNYSKHDDFGYAVYDKQFYYSTSKSIDDILTDARMDVITHINNVKDIINQTYLDLNNL